MIKYISKKAPYQLSYAAIVSRPAQPEETEEPDSEPDAGFSWYDFAEGFLLPLIFAGTGWMLFFLSLSMRLSY